ncbi:MAG: hypothetical protein WC346_15875 [Methanogenium sp.]|jgi:hypothetical protein
MPISGLQRRHSLCKICNSFSDDLLGEITADILLRRRTYKEIKEYYNTKLPAGEKPLSDVNINNHRKHSDPQFLVDAVLQKQGLTPPTEGDVIVRLYEEKRKKDLDKRIILREIYRERLKNLEVLQEMLEATKNNYKEQCSDTSVTNASMWDKQGMENRIVGLTMRIDDIHDSLQQVILKEVTANKDLGEGNTFINNNIIIQDSLKKFLDEFVPYLLHHKVFQDQPEEGKEIVRFISLLMDKHITPALDPQKALPAA